MSELQTDSLLIKVVGWGAAASVIFAGWILDGVPPPAADGTIVPGRFSWLEPGLRGRTITMTSYVLLATGVWAVTSLRLAARVPTSSPVHSHVASIRKIVAVVAFINVAFAVAIGFDLPTTEVKPG